MVSLEIFIDIILPITLWPWGWLSLQQKWIPGTFPGGKGGWCIRLAVLPPSCAVVKSWNLNFLEPSGSLQACNGTDLTFLHFLLEISVLWGKVVGCETIHLPPSGYVRHEWILASTFRIFWFCKERIRYVYTITRYFTLNFVLHWGRELYFLMKLRAALLVT